MRKLSLFLALLLAVAGGACGDSADDTAADDAATTTSAAVGMDHALSKGDKGSFYVSAADQDGDGKTVTVEEVVLTGSKGFIAVHSDAGGAPGPVIGVSNLLEAGTTDDISITLTEPLTASASVFPMLHLDDNGNGTYEFPKADQPAKVGADVVMVKIAVSVGGTAAGGGAEKTMVGGKELVVRGTKTVTDSVDVEVDDNYFEPNVLTAKPGSTITLNLKVEGDGFHNFTVEGQSVDHDLKKGEPFAGKVTVPQSGEVLFFCKYHRDEAGMAGVVRAG